MKKPLYLVLVLAFFSSVQCVDWSKLDSSTLGQLSPRVFETATAQDINSIPDAACSGFTKSQLQSLNVSAASGFKKGQVQAFDDYGTCSGLNGVLISFFTEDAISGMTSSCINNAKDDVFSKVSVDQTKAISSNSVKGIKKKQMDQFSTTGAPGFTKEQVQNFNSDYLGGCSGLNGKLISSFSDNGISGLSSDCIKSGPDDILSLVSVNQTKSLIPTSTKGIKKRQMELFSVNGAAGFTKDQVSNFDSEYLGGCSGLKGSVVRGFTGDAMSGFQKACVHSGPSDIFHSVSSTAIKQLSSSGASGITKSQMENFNPDASSGFTKDQVANFDSEYLGGCSGLNGVVVKNFTGDAMSGFIKACVHVGQDDMFGKVSSLSVKMLSASGASGINKKQMELFSSDGATGFTMEQVSSFDSEYLGGCSGLKGSVVGGFTGNAMSGFKKACVHTGQDDMFNKVSSASVSMLSVAGASGINKVQMQNFNSEGATGFTKDQVNSFDSEYLGGCSGLSGRVVKAFTGDAMSGFEKACVSQGQAYMFQSVTYSSVVALISISGASGIRKAQMENFNVQGAAGFTKDQVSNFDSEYLGGCSGLGGEVLGAFSEEAIKGLTQSCVRSGPDNLFTNVSSTQLSVLAPLSAQYIPTNALKEMNASAAVGFTAEQIVSIQNYNGFTTPVLFNLNTNVIKNLTLISDIPIGVLYKLPASWFNDYGFNCGGTTPSQVKYFNSTLLNALVPRCFSSLPFNYMTNQTMIGLSLDQCPHLTSDQIFSLSVSTTIAMSIPQLNALTNEAISNSGFNTQQLVNLTIVHGVEFANLYPVDRWDPHNRGPYDFPFYVFDEVQPVLPWKKDFIPQLSWLQVALLLQKDAVFDAEFFKKIPDFSLVGLRPDQASSATTEGLASIGLHSLRFIQPKTVNHLSKIQFRSIPSQNFANVSEGWLDKLSSITRHYLTSQQFANIKTTSLDCQFIQSLSPDQFASATAEQKSIIESCGTPNTNGGTTSGGNNNNNNNGPEGKSKAPMIVGIIFGIVGILALGGVALWYFKFRPQQGYTQV